MRRKTTMPLNRITMSVPIWEKTKDLKIQLVATQEVHRLIVGPVWRAVNSRVRAHVEDQVEDQSAWSE